MKQITTFLFLLILLVSSCDEDTIGSDDIFGKWNWVSSYGGIGGTTYAPEITGEKIELEFTIDSIYREYYSGNLIIECKFNVLDSIYYDKLIKIIVYKPGMVRQFYELETPNNLILTDEMCDGYVSTYTRIK